eukprot:m.193068 g.193068  ORF g.193068 m.193068 type:complete len:324 (+) comp16776_c10_seq4:1174-2145(+)
MMKHRIIVVIDSPHAISGTQAFSRAIVVSVVAVLFGCRSSIFKGNNLTNCCSCSTRTAIDREDHQQQHQQQKPRPVHMSSPQRSANGQHPSSFTLSSSPIVHTIVKGSDSPAMQSSPLPRRDGAGAEKHARSSQVHRLRLPSEGNMVNISSPLAQHQKSVASSALQSPLVTAKKSKPPTKNPSVMTMFERDINLLAINKDTTLYSACRAWMAVDTTGDKLRESGRAARTPGTFTLPSPNTSIPIEYGIHQKPDLEKARSNVDTYLDQQLVERSDLERQQRLNHLCQRWAQLRKESNAKVVASYAQRYQDSIRVISRDTKSNVS